jgi:hypothetical protein
VANEGLGVATPVKRDDRCSEKRSVHPEPVEGLPGVSNVFVSPDRMELASDGRPVTVRFADIAQWPRPRWLSQLRKRLGRGLWLPVADRDFFHAPPYGFFCSYTNPTLVS